MADSVVGFVLGHLSELLANEAKLLCGVQDKIRSLHNELRMINMYLKTSSELGKKKKKSKTEIEQEVVNQITDAAHEAEDVIDTFVANVAIHKGRSMLGRMLHVFHHAKMLHDVAQKIDNIKTDLNEIRDNKIKYDNFPESSDRSTTSARVDIEQPLHRLRRNVEDENVVGFLHESKVVIDRLMEGGLGSRRNVVSIIGMGGLGKTTLARKVYNSDDVKRHFNFRTWVYVSNDCRPRELLHGLLKQLMPNSEHDYRRKGNKKGKKHKGDTDKPRDISSFSDVHELKKKVRECLEGKTYLVVLDDLWKKQDWDEVQDAFPDENRGNRILITSRHKEVASHTSRDPPYCLQLLTQKESWKLFSGKVFRGEECPFDLEPLGKQMVKSCHGLPLSIVVLAGLLTNKEKSHREWSKVAGHVNWYLTQDETQVKNILNLSYDDLPTRLRPCFLYLGIFPEDSEIHVRQLLQRWVAEGFIQETGSRDPEDVAEDYLYELVDRSLIQVARVKDSGRVKTCRIHDLLRDLCIYEGKEDKVFQVCMDNSILIPKPRRLSIHCAVSPYLSSTANDHSCVRSLFCFDPQFFVHRKEWKCLSKGFKLVRVLDLEAMDSVYHNDCMKIPSNLGNFIHLRYLRIWGYTDPIPDSICNLPNLQTLDLASSLLDSSFGNWRFTLTSFPRGIWKLKHLRHMYIYGTIMLRGNQSVSDGEVWNLQTISYIELNKRIASLAEKGRFPKLRKLGLSIFRSSDIIKGDLPKLLLSLQHLRHLNKLKIYFQRNDFRYSLQEIGCKPQEVLQSLKHLNNLSELEIDNALELATCASSFPPNITKLILGGITCLNDDGVNAFGNLPKLRILRLEGQHTAATDTTFDFNCVGGSFPQLLVFQMRGLEIQNWKLANAAMPYLQSLVIGNCKRMDSLPTELWSLTALRKVYVWKPSHKMDVMLKNLQVKNGCELNLKYDWEAGFP